MRTKNTDMTEVMGTLRILTPTHRTIFSVLILAINQLNAKIFFYSKFIIRLYMFRALCAHHQEVKIVLCSIWYNKLIIKEDFVH